MSDITEFASQAESRKWLCDHCTPHTGVWLLYGKHGGPETHQGGRSVLLWIDRRYGL